MQTFVAVTIIGLLNFAFYVIFRYSIPLLFTEDPDVIELVAVVIPVVALMQIIDGMAAGAGGILRGIGKQSMGGPANLFAYYVVSLPCSIALAFGLNWKLSGLWSGCTIGLVV